MPGPTRPEGPPAAVAVVAGPVRERLAEVLAVERQRWAALDPALDRPFEALESFVLRGGKRLRPAFCHWGFVAAGGDADDAAVVDAGAAFELLHAFALIHDDVMDGSARRRREPSVHAAFAGVHRAESLRGEDRRFGEGVAILVGDLAQVYAGRLMSGAPPEALAIWHELEVEVNVGQYLDLVGSATGSVSLDAARRISRYKSGKYTIERPLQVGAALAHGTPALHEALSAYGDPLGEAFQLRDDLLGAFGDPALTGKPVGEDLREGKPTPLLALARERTDDPAVAAVLERVGDPTLDDADVAVIQDVLRASGAVEQVEVLIASLHDEAIGALEGPIAASSAARPLVELAEHVTVRSW